MTDLFYRCSAATLYEVAALLDKRNGSHVPADEVMKALADLSGDESLIHSDAEAELGVPLDTTDEYETCDECGGTGTVWVDDSESLPVRKAVRQLRLLAKQAELADALGFSEVPA